MSWRTAYGATLALAAAAIAAPWWGHVDDGDAHLYRVVARNMVEDGTWFDLRYLPGAHAQFREHLPFGLWPMAAAIRLAGEGALPFLGAAFSLGTVALVIWIGRRLAGPVAGVLAGLVLATTETFVLYGGREKLDPPLVFFATAAMAPLLVSGLKARAVAIAGVFGALAVLVKGPFGLLPVGAAALSRLWRDRNARSLIAGAVVGLLAVAPLIAFLLYDRLGGDGTWWRGYVIDQVQASAAGHRTDGESAFYFPLLSLLGRFWPGLLLVAFAVFKSVRPGDDDPKVLRTLGLSVLIVVIALCVPARKLWNHTLIAYPLLALFGAVGVAPVVERWLATARRQHRFAAALVALAAVAWTAALLGAGRSWGSNPTIACAELSPLMDRFAPGTRVAVASKPMAWKLIAALASERRILAWPIVEPGAPLPENAALLFWRFDAPAPEGWRELDRARGWIVYER